MIFNKKDIIFSNGIGVCEVSDIQNLSVNKKEPIKYYLLTSVFDKHKTAYIPVNEHQVVLRQLISKEEAALRKDNKENTLLEAKEIEYVLARLGGKNGK